MNWFPMREFPDLAGDEALLLLHLLQRTNRAENPFTATTPTGTVTLLQRQCWISQKSICERFGWTRDKARWVLRALVKKKMVEIAVPQPLVGTPPRHPQDHTQGSHPGGNTQGVSIITVTGAWISGDASSDHTQGVTPRGHTHQIETSFIETPKESLPLFEGVPVSLPTEAHPLAGSGVDPFERAWNEWIRVKRRSDQRTEAERAFRAAVRRIARKRRTTERIAGEWLADRIVAGVAVVKGLNAHGEVPALAVWCNQNRYDFEGDGFAGKILEGRRAREPQESPRDAEFRRQQEANRAEVLRREEARRRGSA